MDKNALNEKQKKAVETPSQYVRVIAGAGSGKTRVLTYRLAFLVHECNVEPWRILAITFTNKVAKEMKDRLLSMIPEHNYLQIMTFHGFCNRFLRAEIHHLGFPTSFSIIDEDDQKKIIKDIAKDFEYSSRDGIVKEAIDFISKKKSQGQYPQHVDDSKMIYQQDKELLRFFERYEEKKNEMFLLDFDDLLLRTIQILMQYPAVREKWQNRYHHILIDEFQDTNNIEYNLIELLLKPSTSLYVVGDPDQTIYTWRGANQDIILTINKKFKAETIILDQNYRSTITILNAANKLIAHNKKREEKNLFSKKDSDEVISFRQAYLSIDEAEWVAERIMELRNSKNVSYPEIAVLYRASYLTLPLEKAFNKYKIPYRIFGGLRFYQRREIKDVLAYFRLLTNQKDDLSFERIINVPRRNIGETSVLNLKIAANQDKSSLYNYVAQMDVENSPLKKSAAVSLKELINIIDDTRNRVEKNEEILSEVLRDYITRLQYFEYLHLIDEDGGPERVENVESLFDDILHFVQDNPEGGFDEYLQNVSLLSAQDDLEGGEYVSLMTIHTAKGLEYPNVFVIGINEGVFPSNRSLEESGFSGLEEERRLCYVAFTRAMDRLFLSCNSEYSYVIGAPKIPSRFLKEAGINTAKKGTYYTNDFHQEKEKKVSLFNDVLTNNVTEWRKGDIVQHINFGEGVVTEVLDDKIIKVSFALSGDRLLLSNHPSLKKIKQGEFDA